MKFSVTVTLKKEVLDPQGKVVENTLKSMGLNSLKSVRQGKYFEIEVEEKNEEVAEKEVTQITGKTESGKIQTIQLTPDLAKAYNPAFDVTPHDLVNAIISERGIARPPFEPTLRTWVFEASKT